MAHRSIFSLKSIGWGFLCALIFLATVNAAPPLQPNEPIALYLTWQRDPTTTMTIQWITPAAMTNSHIDFHSASDTFWKPANGHTVAIPGDERYIIHRVELLTLIPNQDYFFRLGGTGKTYNFRTMPASGTTPIRFVVGGDIYHDGIEKVRNTNLQAARQSPWFALVGGDLAYGADKFGLLPEGWQSWMEKLLAKVDIGIAKRQRWIDWLALWKDTMVTPEGRLIPLVPALGNHDVNGGFGKTAADAAIFHHFFPFPGLTGYNALDFGSYMSIIVLDSGHTNAIGGQQTRWLYDVLRARSAMTHKFALYHVPAYPSVRKFNGKTSSAVRHFWVPLFEMYRLTAAFEHHDHAYKRTYPLKQGAIDPRGVLFFGDGAWGVEKPRIPPSGRWYIAHAAGKTHFIMVTLKGKECHFAAIDPQGDIFDQFSTGPSDESAISGIEKHSQ